MNPPGVPNYFLKCYITMLVIMILFVAGLFIIPSHDNTFIPFEMRLRGAIFALFVPALLSFVLTFFHFKGRMPA